MLVRKNLADLYKESGNGWFALHLPQSAGYLRLCSGASSQSWMHLKGELDDVDFETVERARRLMKNRLAANGSVITWFMAKLKNKL